MLNYIAEALPAFARTWRIVGKESLWLEKTRKRLFSQTINADQNWLAEIGLDEKQLESALG